jgi:hypothetical protein
LCDRAAEVHSRFLSLLREGLADLVVAWRWSDREAQELSRQLQALVGTGCGRGGSEASEAVVTQSGPGLGRPERLGSERCLFFMGLASGWMWESALRDLGDLGPGVLDQESTRTRREDDAAEAKAASGHRMTRAAGLGPWLVPPEEGRRGGAGVVSPTSGKKGRVTRRGSPRLLGARGNGVPLARGRLTGSDGVQRLLRMGPDE